VTTDWIEIAGGSFAIGLEREEAIALAVTSAAAARRAAGLDPDPLHGLLEDEELRDQSGNVAYLASRLRALLPAHTVELAPYRVARAPVTNAEYRRFMASAVAVKPPAGWAYPDGDADERAVIGVSWTDAAAYATWAGARLPSEAEWERAARGSDRLLFPWGNTYDPRGQHLEILPMYVTVKPGSLDGYASPEGCVDMVMRNWEWCSDGFEPYPNADAAVWAKAHSVGAGFRARRGGRVGHVVASAVNRDGGDPGVSYASTCFRLAEFCRGSRGSDGS
jgi:formylglycine-generating enzyme required for sulfatase activity